MPFLSNQMHRRLLHFSLSLYLIATWCSMAGMEIFGWLTAVIVFTYFLRKPADETLRVSDFSTALPWKSCIALVIITALGIFINGTPQTDELFAIGSQRWVIVLFFLSLALSVSFPTLKSYRFFLGFVIILALYAIFQSLTGIDILRPGSHRAVQPLGLKSTIELWRSSGFFGSPLQYGYIAGFYACLCLAMALLTFARRKEFGWIFTGSVSAFILLTTSIITTFTRGAWIAMVVAFLFVAWTASKKIAACLVGVGAAVFTILFSTVDIFRMRVLTLFNSGYGSNSDRVFLWKANWEMFKDYPILGIGYQENEVRAGEYVARLGQPDAFTGHAHNNYLQMLAGTGITGFLTYMFIISFMLWLTWRLWKTLPQEMIWPRAIALGALGAQIHLHIGGFTEANFKTGTTNHNFMVVWALIVALTVLQKKGLLRSKAS
ncbi:MAG TPA: O-antigen ligase family protein [Bdellovibrionales bacterium]|nr:O-antigen ligase family protein [Bdellovibrionales bacterium]